MRSHLSSGTIGRTIVFGSVICMAATMVLAQRVGERAAGEKAKAAPATELQPPRATEPQQPRATDRQRSPDRNAPVDRAAERQPSRPDVEARPQLGLKFAGDDLTIAEVAPGTAAASAGFKAQDRIISVDELPITGQRRLQAVLSGISGRIPVVVERGGRQYTISLMLDSFGERPWLGVYLQDNQENERGARITHVYPAGPAARAGLRTGDVIVEANGEQIQASYDLIATIDALQPQSKVKLKVLRGDQEMDAVATLAARDSFVFQSSPSGGQYGDRGGLYDERRQGGFGGRERYTSDDPYENIPPYAMQMEHDRRNAEQHERIEAELRKLQEEVRMLREAIQRK